MTLLIVRKISIIYLVISFISIAFILIAKANNEIDISAERILIDKKSNIVNASGDVLIKNDQLSINSDEAIFTK